MNQVKRTHKIYEFYKTESHFEQLEAKLIIKTDVYMWRKRITLDKVTKLNLGKNKGRKKDAKEPFNNKSQVGVVW